MSYNIIDLKMKIWEIELVIDMNDTNERWWLVPWVKAVPKFNSYNDKITMLSSEEVRNLEKLY